MEKRKDGEQHSNDDSMDTGDCSNSKIVFKRQSSSKEHRKPSFNHSASIRKEIATEEDESEEKPTLKGSKVLMPEYVIGQKVASKTKRKSITKPSTETNKSDGPKRPTLQHLFDEEDENED